MGSAQERGEDGGPARFKGHITVVHEAPAIFGRQTRSALAHAA
jgi:hypothetical protein